MQQQINYRSGNQPKSSAPQSRSNKTLAWFLTDPTLEKKIQLSSSPSSKSLSGQNSIPLNNNNNNTEKMVLMGGGKEGERRKRRVHRKSKARHDSHTSPSEGSAMSDSPGDEKQKIVTDFKEDYWYYDVATDGYYYEQNGAKGWRKRQPNADPKKIQQEQVATSPVSEKTASPASGVDARALQMIQQALYGQPAYKYYDPNSDGYYYEMASVDGWRKRQPTRPASQQAPRLPTANPIQQAAFQSYGAALARGQMPRNCIISESSASSSTSDDPTLQELLLSQMEDMSIDAQMARPSKLQGSDLRNSFNPDRFLESFVFPEHKGIDLSSARTPMTPLKTSTSALETPRGPFDFGNNKPVGTTQKPEINPMWGGWGYNGYGSLTSGHKDDELLGSSILGDLQKIWQAPTPTA